MSQDVQATRTVGRQRARMLRPCHHDAAARTRSGRFAPIPACFSAELRALSEDLLQRDPERRPTLDALLARPFVRRHLGALAARVRAGGMRRQASFERTLAALRLPLVRPGWVCGCWLVPGWRPAGARRLSRPGAAPRPCILAPHGRCSSRGIFCGPAGGAGAAASKAGGQLAPAAV